MPIQNYIRLPRNFSFLNRLPTRFIIEILSIGNSTKEGTWHAIKINNQLMNLMSLEKLKPGQKLLLEKDGTLKLKIIKTIKSTNPPEKEELKTMKSLEAKSETKAHDTNNFLHLFHDAIDLVGLALVHKNLGNVNTHHNSSELKYSFSLPLAYFEKKSLIHGIIIIAKRKNWQVLLNVQTDGKDDVEKMKMISALSDGLLGFLSGYPIDAINCTSFKTIKMLMAGSVDLQR